MAQDKSILEEAIIQMKNLEEAVAENAKGILGSVMSKEIKELVKESLTEAEEEEEEVEDDEMEDEDMDEFEMEDDEMEFDMDDEDMTEPDMESPETIDLTNAPASEVLKVFKLLSPEDEIVVTKDSASNIHLKDGESGKEYMIVGEGEEEEFDEMWDMDEMDSEEEEMDEMYEEEEDMEDMMEMYSEEDMEDMMEMESDEEMDETIYEIEMESDEEEDMEEEYMMESKKEFKAKGMGMGKPEFTYGKVMDYKTTKMKKGDEAPYTGKGKVSYEFDKTSPSLKGEFKEGKYGMNKGDKSKTHKGEEDYTGKKGLESKTHKGLDFEKAETKEASRTYGMGSKSGRGLRKAITPNRNLTFESVNTEEVQILREKNEEYRKALNIFRNKLNEVAVFNSNLAYATRLFTEHSTSKQEKINILKRFDSVETIKESKNLYKTIKDELTGTKGNQITESIERTIEKAPSTGSAINLIESKTYENPQFLRMKDLMSKLK